MRQAFLISQKSLFMFFIRTGFHGCHSMDFNSIFVLELPQCFPRKRLGHLLHQLVPGQSIGAAVGADHRDTLIDWADDETEPAPDAIGFTDPRLIFFIMRKEVDALMCSVITGNIAKIALNAF